MPSASPTDSPTDLAMAAFDPALYCPRPAVDVELFDRGPEEPEEARFVLSTNRGRTSLIISENDKLLWEMFDGKTSVNDICHQFLSRHRTLVLNRIFSLIQRLWASGFLLNNPKIAPLVEAGVPAWYGSLRFAHWSPIPLPGMHVLTRAAAHLIRSLRLQSRPAIALQLVLIAIGGICFNGLSGHFDYSIIKISGNYEVPWIGMVPESCVAGLLLLLLLHLICSFVRNFYLAANEVAATGRCSDFCVEFNYFIPAFAADCRWLPTLPYRRRLAAATAGILIELDLGAIGAILCQLLQWQGLAGELLFKLTFVFFARAFLHLSPFAGSDLPWILELLSNARQFSRRALGFFRYSFVKALLGEIQLGAEQKFYLACNLFSAFWLGLAASFGFGLLSANQYIVRNLLYVYAHSAELTGSLVLDREWHISADLAILAEERHLLAVVVGVFLILVLLALVVSICWGLYVFGRWAESLPVWRKPAILVSFGLLVIVVMTVGLHLQSTVGQYAASQARAWLHGITYAVALGGAVYMLPQLGQLGRSWLATKFGTLTLAMLLGALALWIEGDWAGHSQPIAILHGLVAVLAVFAILAGIAGRIHLLAFRNTEFFLPGLAILMGSLVLAIGSLRAVMGGPEQALALDHNRLVGSGMVLLGMAVFLRLLRHLDLPIESIAIDMSKDTPAEALKRILAYVMEATARIVSSKFGEPALAAIENRFNAGLAAPAFAFSSIYVDEDATAEEIGRLYRERLDRVRRLLASMYGERFACRVFDGVFGKVHWECKQVLDTYLFPYSPWEKRYTSEQELSAEARTRLIEEISMFGELAPNERQLLVRHSMVCRFRAGELIVNQGDYGDACYIIVSGEVQVEERDSTGDTRLLAFLRGGDFFGESALLTHSPRTASVRATTSCLMLSLARSDFEKFSQQYPEMVSRIRDRLQNLQALLRIPLFGDLPPSVLRSVLPRIRAARYDEGDTIIAQGDIGKHFYLIKTGAVEVLATRGGAQESICELGPRDYFGEIALLKDIPRTATVRATRSTEVLVLEKDDFSQLSQASRIFAQNVELVGRQRMAAN